MITATAYDLSPLTAIDIGALGAATCTFTTHKRQAFTLTSFTLTGVLKIIFAYCIWDEFFYACSVPLGLIY